MINKVFLLLVVSFVILGISFSISVTGPQFNFTDYRAKPITNSSFFQYGQPYNQKLDGVSLLQNGPYYGKITNDVICHMPFTPDKVINGYAVKKDDNSFKVFNMVNCTNVGTLNLNYDVNDWAIAWINDKPLLFTMSNNLVVRSYKLNDLSLYRQSESMFKYYYDMSYRNKIEFNVLNNTGYYLIELNTKYLISKGLISQDGSDIMIVDDINRQILDWYVVPGTWDTDDTQIVVKLLPTTKVFGMYFNSVNNIEFNFRNSLDGFLSSTSDISVSGNGYNSKLTSIEKINKFMNYTIVSFNVDHSSGTSLVKIEVPNSDPMYNFVENKMFIMLDYNKLYDNSNSGKLYLNDLYYYYYKGDNEYTIYVALPENVTIGGHKLYIFWDNVDNNYKNNKCNGYNRLYTLASNYVRGSYCENDGNYDYLSFDKNFGDTTYENNMIFIYNGGATSSLNMGVLDEGYGTGSSHIHYHLFSNQFDIHMEHDEWYDSSSSSTKHKAIVYVNLNGTNNKVVEVDGKSTVTISNALLEVNGNTAYYDFKFYNQWYNGQYTYNNNVNTLNVRFSMSYYAWDTETASFSGDVIAIKSNSMYTGSIEYEHSNNISYNVIYNNNIKINSDIYKSININTENVGNGKLILYGDGGIYRFDITSGNNLINLTSNGYINGIAIVSNETDISLDNIIFHKLSNVNYYQELNEGFGLTANEYNGTNLVNKETIQNVDLSWNKSIDGYDNLELNGYFYPKDGPGNYLLYIVGDKGDTISTNFNNQTINVTLRKGLDKLDMKYVGDIGIYCGNIGLNYTYIGGYYIINNSLSDNETCLIYTSGDRTYNQTELLNSDGIYAVFRHNTWSNHPSNHNQLMQLWSQTNYEYGHGVLNEIYQSNNPYGLDDHYADHYKSYFYTNKSGTWCFATDSDDASEIQVDGNVIVGWYGGHGVANNWGHNSCIYLDKGWHEVDYYHEEGTGDQSQRMAISFNGTSNWKVYSTSNFDVRYNIPNVNRTKINNIITYIDVNNTNIVPVDIKYTDNGDGLASLKIELYKDGNYIGILNSNYTVPESSNLSYKSNIDLDFAIGKFDNNGIDEIAYVDNNLNSLSLLIYDATTLTKIHNYYVQNILGNKLMIRAWSSGINNTLLGIVVISTDNLNYYYPVQDIYVSTLYYTNGSFITHTSDTWEREGKLYTANFFNPIGDLIEVHFSVGTSSSSTTKFVADSRIGSEHIYKNSNKYSINHFSVISDNEYVGVHSTWGNINDNSIACLSDGCKDSTKLSHTLAIKKLYSNGKLYMTGLVKDTNGNVHTNDVCYSDDYFVGDQQSNIGWQYLHCFSSTSDNRDLIIGRFSGNNNTYIYAGRNIYNSNNNLLSSNLNPPISGFIIDADMDGKLDLVRGNKIYSLFNANKFINKTIYRQQYSVHVGENVPIIIDLTYKSNYLTPFGADDGYYSTVYLPDLVSNSGAMVIKQGTFSEKYPVGKIENNTLFFLPTIPSGSNIEYQVIYYATPVQMIKSEQIQNNNYKLYMNFTGGKEINYFGIIADVPVPESVYYPHLYYYENGSWVDVTSNKLYNFQTIDDNHNGLIDHIKFILPSVEHNTTERYMLGAIYSNPVICNVTKKVLTNAPITASQYAYWNWTVVCTNPNDFGVNFDSVVDLPLKSSEILLDGNLTQVNFSAKGYGVHIKGYLGSGDNVTHYITFKTPPITVIPQFYFPNQYFVDQYGNIMIKLDVRNWATEPLPNVHISIPITYGKNIKIYSKNGTLINSVSEVQGILDFVVPVIQSQEAQEYTIKYNIPVGTSSSPISPTTTIINGTQYVVKYIKIQSQTPVPIDKNVFYISDVPCGNISKVIQVNSFSSDFGDNLEFTCNGTKAIINLGSLEVGQNKMIKIYYRGTLQPHKIAPISNATQSIKQTFSGAVDKYNSFWKDIFENDLHVQYNTTAKAIAWLTPLVIIGLIYKLIMVIPK